MGHTVKSFHCPKMSLYRPRSSFAFSILNTWTLPFQTRVWKEMGYFECRPEPGVLHGTQALHPPRTGSESSSAALWV